MSKGSRGTQAPRALLFGVRTPVLDSAPIVVPVRLKDLGGQWAMSNLEALEPIRLGSACSGGAGESRMVTDPDGQGLSRRHGQRHERRPSPFASTVGTGTIAESCGA